MKFDAPKGIVIAGHRGNPALYPENTLQSFASAIDCGVDMIETDIRITKDGELVLMHDADVKRTTDGCGLVRDLSLKQLKTLNAGNGQSIPTLVEFLELCKPHKKLLYDLEIKVYKEEDGADAVAYAVDKTAQAADEYGISDRVIINSFDAYVLEYTRKKYGRKFLIHGYYPYGILGKNMSVNPDAYLDYACYWAQGEQAKRTCEYLLSRGIAPCTGSDTTRQGFIDAVKNGCAMFTENDPKTVLAWRDEL
ncbi:MAG: hypothetical protein K2O94_01475 [Clostridiales bacterium]|nr:hypothetical protein [Clostridiales bacterium]